MVGWGGANKNIANKQLVRTNGVLDLAGQLEVHFGGCPPFLGSLEEGPGGVARRGVCPVEFLEQRDLAGEIELLI